MTKAADKKLTMGHQVCLRLEGLHPKGRMEIPNGNVVGIEEDGIYINIPIMDKKYLEGRSVEILWENGMCLYCLSSTINKYVNKDDSMIVVSPSYRLRSIDRRRYFRLQQPIHIEFKPKDYKGLFISAEGKDVSGGGARFLTKYLLDCGQQLEMLLEVPIFPYLDVSALASVVSVEKRKKTGSTQVGVHFIDIEPMGRKRLLKYIMDEHQPLNDKEEEKRDLRFWFCLN
jgi:c-di-GMP-binding flagellar brake protein YcgR